MLLLCYQSHIPLPLALPSPEAASSFQNNADSQYIEIRTDFQNETHFPSLLDSDNICKYRYVTQKAGC